MIYLDYAAHTSADKLVLDEFLNTETKYIANANSSHHLGNLAKIRLAEATDNIKRMLNLKEQEIIYTSGATESNNLAIKGIAGQYCRQGKHIITSYLEHSSVTGPIVHLQDQGFEVDFVNVNSDGSIDFEHLCELLREDTILLSLSCVDSEAGTVQDIDKIGKMLANYPNCFFHVDATQAVCKVPVSFKNADLVSFSAHKFYGINGVGALIKKKNVLLTPILHGGVSTTVYRSGTPALSLIASMEKAMSIIDVEENYRYVKMLNDKIRMRISGLVLVNSPSNGSPFILNVSTFSKKSTEIQKRLEEKEIYLSTKSACCAPNAPSRPVYAITKDKKRALNTLRISLSHKTSEKDVDIFTDIFVKMLKG